MFSALRKLKRRVRYWLHRDQYESDLREEMEQHRRLRGAASITSPAFHMEDASAVWMPASAGSFLQDLRYGLRQLRHNPMFTVVSLTGLALAIGLNTAVFSIIEAVYWRPLPVADGDRVVRILRIAQDGAASSSFSEEELRHYQQSGALAEVTGFALDDRITAEWPGSDTPRAIGVMVAPNFFTMLGGQAVLGRLLRPDDTGPVVLITETAWRRRLAMNPGAAGSKLLLNGFPFTVVGVIAAKSAAILETPAEIVLPLASAALLQVPEAQSRIRLLGKLPAQTTIDEAQTALGVVAHRWLAAHPDEKRQYSPLAIHARLTGSRPPSAVPTTELMLPVAVLLVLLVACANLTNLLLARAEARRGEMAIRLSLGASRSRLVRQLLTECLLLTTSAGSLGLLCANAALRAAQSMLPVLLPIEVGVPWLDLSINTTVFLFTMALCVFTAAVFGLVPAMEATRTDVAGTMKQELSRGGARVRSTLIAVQMGVCVILLIITASLNNGMTVLTDFLSAIESAPVVHANINLAAYGYSEAGGREFLDRLRARVSALPEVESAGFGLFPLVRILGGSRADSELEIEGGSQRLPPPGMRAVMSDSVLHVFGMRLTSGRDFSAAESRADAPVVLINQPMAEALWPRSSALGRRIRIWSKGKPGRWQEVIGVVAEKAVAGDCSVSHSIFYPAGSATNGWLQVRTRGERGKAALAVRRVIRELDPRIAANVTSLSVIVDFMRWGPRLVAICSVIVAISSLLMAAIGLYGVTAYIAARRTKEIGIRMALGAHPGHILRIMTRRGGQLVATGLIVGSMLAFAAERVLAAGMQLIPASQPVTYLSVAGFLGGVAMMAILLPSLRAARMNPVAALRHDG